MHSICSIVFFNSYIAPDVSRLNVSTMTSDSSLIVSFQVRYFFANNDKLFMVSQLKNSLQPLADSNTNYSIILENSCTHTTTTAVPMFVNGLVTCTVQYPQNWTNISIVAENNCKSILAKNISNTGVV